MTKNERIRQILTDLERTRDNLMGLSDDIWLGIDHNDPEAFEAGVDFKRKYNERMLGFDRLANEISQLVQDYTKVAVESSVPHDAKPSTSPKQPDVKLNDRIIKELNCTEAHGIGEEFTYKRPYGFILKGRGYKEIVTWRYMYELFCRQLMEMDAAKFNSLPNHADLVSNRGNPAFARDPKILRVAMPLQAGIYAEINLSANHLRDQMRRLLKIFAIRETEMVIYLRQDRDATAE